MQILRNINILFLALLLVFSYANMVSAQDNIVASDNFNDAKLQLITKPVEVYGPFNIVEYDFLFGPETSNFLNLYSKTVANEDINFEVLGNEGRLGKNLHIFPKWIDALKRNQVERSLSKIKCENDSQLFFCNIEDWLGFIASIKGKPASEQISLVNKYVNKKKYVLDNVNWEVEDYWASPGEFLTKNGDCEDFSIIKYLSLAELGFSENNMRLVILNDENLGIIHAVLAVNFNDKIKILDNQISKVTEDKKIMHYTPIYSVNRFFWWRHI